MKISLVSSAETDIAESINYYSNINLSVASRFLGDLDDTIGFLSRFPEASPEVYKNIRRKLLKIFPYGVYYSYHQDEITVYAVIHESRNPEILYSRV